MLLNVECVRRIMAQNDWSERRLAAEAGLSEATISRVLSGKRGAGARTLAGMRNAFPDVPVETLFFLEKTLPNSSNSGLLSDETQ
jgi:transcriptional regulator with XRE-family HTH domain